MIIFMMERICEQLKAWRKEMRPVLVKSASSKTFCVGGDIKEALSKELEILKNLSLFTSLVATYPAPYVALIDGLMMGAGCSIFVHGQFRVATERTVLAMPEVDISHFPDVDASCVLPRPPGRLGYLLVITGHQLEGRQVMEAGLATHYCRSTSLLDLQEALVSCAGLSYLDIERILEGHTQSRSSCIENTIQLDLEDVEMFFSAATIEGIMLRLEHLNHTWAYKTLAGMAVASPTSFKVTKKLLDKGAKMNLQECLLMEYGLTISGIRARVTDFCHCSV
ncbi:hypothetical protein PR048_023136 [Dryococelus australis]|uniref:3-hydroxyisobutyryl-CoA hydrolase, mitochondrial n=1 Tax=Dryococelus australis TaxID=614101 RepID=A0ABQ9GTA4_9NEOP|nr:hypothetical protein PR048_023136 [Dryococelus australis]